MITVGIIIPFYGGEKYIKTLIHSILTYSDGLSIKIYIIDNSELNDRLDCKKYASNEIIIINEPVSIGYGKACNIGYRKCIEEKIDIAVIVNQDGYFSAGSLKKMVDTLLMDDDFTAAVPLLTEYESNKVEPFFTHVYLSPMTDLVSDLFAGVIKSYYPILDLCGACFALKLKDYQQVPYLFDELYQMYYEDGDLYHRLNRMKKQVMFVPSAIFHHNHTNTKGHLQTVASLAVKRTSKHIYTLKNTGSSFGKAFTGWALLEFRNMIESLFKLNFRNLAVELISCIKLLGKLAAIRKIRKAALSFAIS